MSEELHRFYEAAECGTDGYPPEWHATLKHAVRDAAGHRCVRCFHPYRNGEHGKGDWSRCDERCTHGGPFRCRLRSTGTIAWEDEYRSPGPPSKYLHDGSIIEAAWRILTVHHLDGDKANCRWWNLAALCQRCHLTVQGKVQMARVWPWEHSEWFRPYVAGYYAWTYLGESLTRNETEARLDELLALERQVA